MELPLYHSLPFILLRSGITKPPRHSCNVVLHSPRLALLQTTDAWFDTCWISFRSSLLTLSFSCGVVFCRTQTWLVRCFCGTHWKMARKSNWRSVGCVQEMFQDQRVPYSHFLRWIFAPASNSESGHQADVSSHLARINTVLRPELPRLSWYGKYMSVYT